jgi:manganese/iron transport system substrate-binding protein
VAFVLAAISLVAFALLPGCSSTEATDSGDHELQQDENDVSALTAVSLIPGEKLKVVATTSIIADVVANIGGDRIQVTALVPQGTDPHSFEPTPSEVAAVSEADVIFANGAGLEEFLESLVESAGSQARTIRLSQGIALLEFDVEEDGGQHESGSGDPHTWTDPTNVLVWVDNILDALERLDPEGAEVHEQNALAYKSQLEALDAWVRRQTGEIPESERLIVTDHQIFAYYADEYGFRQVGAIVPGYSSVAEPSAREVAKLEETIRELGVKAIFVGNTVNPSLAQRVAEDTGTQLVFIYTGSLSEAGGDADTYLDYIRFNTRAIVDALK